MLGVGCSHGGGCGMRWGAVSCDGWDGWMNGWMDGRGCPRRGCGQRVGSNPGKGLGSMGGGDDTTEDLPAVPSSPEPARLLQHGLAAR